MLLLMSYFFLLTAPDNSDLIRADTSQPRVLVLFYRLGMHDYQQHYRVGNTLVGRSKQGRFRGRITAIGDSAVVLRRGQRVRSLPYSQIEMLKRNSTAWYQRDKWTALLMQVLGVGLMAGGIWLLIRQFFSLRWLNWLLGIAAVPLGFYVWLFAFVVWAFNELGNPRTPLREGNYLKAMTEEEILK